MTEEINSAQSKSKLIALIITGSVIILALFFGIQLIWKIGFFHKSGEIIFGDSATEVNRDFVNSNLGDIVKLDLKENITVEAYELPYRLNEDPSHESYTRLVLYDILLPVTDFYSSEIFTTFDDAKNHTLISVWNLSPSQKLLGLAETNDATEYDYYLDNLDRGGFFQYLTISGKHRDDVDRIADRLSSNIAAFPDKDTLLTLAQTGVTALSRRMNTKLDQVSDASYFAENIKDLLSSFDLTHTSNESSFSASANGSNICSKPAMINTLISIGLDIVELTGNHNQDCGDQDAIDTITQYHSLGIQTLGGGINATEAAQPVEINQKSNNITMLGYNLSTGGYTLDDTPGANFYTEEKAQADITTAKERGDFVIVDIQYYECNEYVDTNENTICDHADSSAGNQIEFFRHLIDLGADIVVGTAAHQPQTFELYKDGAIYYGLGNLFFDQSTWPGTTRSLILIHYFWKDNLIQTRILPTFYDNNFQTRLLDNASASQFLKRLTSVRPAQP